MCLSNFKLVSLAFFPPSRPPATHTHTHSRCCGACDLKAQICENRKKHAYTLEVLRMTVLSCMLKTKSMRLAFFREAHEMGAGDADTAEGKHRVCSVSSSFLSPLILSHQLPAQQSQETDVGFSKARSQYVTKLGNAHALPLLRREACGLLGRSWEKPSQEQSSCSLPSLESSCIPFVGSLTTDCFAGCPV